MMAAGKLIVFEGPDGVGKSALASAVAEKLKAGGMVVQCLAFPGNERGTLGHLIYRVHHDPHGVLGGDIAPAALQTLHVAAHIDAIQRTIEPALRRGESIVLDRYWWSTWVYGRVAGIPENLLKALIELERTAWGDIQPASAFLIESKCPWREDVKDRNWNLLVKEYSALAEREAQRHLVERVTNNRPLEAVVEHLVTAITRSGRESKGDSGRPFDRLRRRAAPPGERQLMLAIENATHLPKRKRQVSGASFAPAVTSPVFDTYWRFAIERQEVFFRRLEGAPPPWSEDPILQRHRFTNAYRASDRVSQYLIRQVQYAGDFGPDDLFFRTILFKLFNRIETWEMLERTLGGVHVEEFTPERYAPILQRAMGAGQRIYSAAYIMPAAPGTTGQAKHVGHLQLIARMLRDELPRRLSAARSLRHAFELIRAYPMMGDFLAFQYVIDLNYSPLLNFSEMEFVVPGPGARSGLRKCFRDVGGLSEADLIRLVTERQAKEFARRGLVFRDLWGRPLQLIDCQNLFCEVDKYARMAHPEISDPSGRTRIKQVLRPGGPPPWPWYPPKWGLNQRVQEEQEAAHAPDRG